MHTDNTVIECYIVLLLTTRCSHSTTRCLHIGTRYFYSTTTRWLQRFILPSHLMMKFCRGRFIRVFPIQHIFYKCGQYFLHVLVKGDGLLSSNAFLGSLSVLSWYTRFHFVDNSVGLLFEVLCILIFVKCCATGLASTPKTKLKQYIYVIIYFKVLFSNFGTFKLTSLHYFTYIMSIIEDGKSIDNCLLL